jgi:thioredoxin 1
MSRGKQYASYKSLEPKKEISNYKCMETQDLHHRKKLLNDHSLVCVKLHADWCEPCKIIAPHFNKLGEQYNIPGKCLLTTENVDLELTRDYQITGIPAFIFYHKGKLVKKDDGQPVSVVGGDIKQVQEILDKFLPQLK